MATRNYLLAALLLLSLPAFSQIPLYKSCESCTDTLCNAMADSAFKDSVEHKVFSRRGYEFNDSICFKFHISPTGEVIIEERFFLNSETAAKLCEAVLINHDNWLSEKSYGQYYNISFVFEISESYLGFEEVEAVKRPIPIKACGSFNKKAQKGCVRYLAMLTEHYFTERYEVEGTTTAKLFLRKGKLVAVEYDAYPLDKFYHDLIYKYFNMYASEHVDWDKADGADDQRIDFKITNYRDSAHKFHYVQGRLEYLADLQDKKPYLAAMLEAAGEYYQDDQRTQFILDGLKKVGFMEREGFRLQGRYYDIDSIREYKFTEKEEVELPTEKVPIYAKCDPDDDNEKLRFCFQRKMMRHVAKAFEYPEEARQNRIQGKVYVNFAIDKDGSIGDLEIVRSVHPLLDFESIRVVSLLPDMDAPAMQRGEPVRMSFTLPINARLR